MDPSFILKLPAINATLNGAAAVLLVYGWLQIRAGRERTHKVAMLSAFVVSIVFLACYLTYHWGLSHYYDSPGVPFRGPAPIRAVYLTILLTHVVLATAVPVLASVTIYLGLRDRRASHHRLARWTLPIWLYVSVTGVVIYVMLYHLYPGGSQELIINRAGRAVPAEVEK